MRLVEARREAALLGVIFGLCGTASVALGYALEEYRRWWLDAIAAVVFAGIVGSDFRKVSRRAPLVQAAATDPPPLVLPAGAALLTLAVTAVSEEPLFGAIILGAAVGQVIGHRFLKRFERRTGYLVLRRKGRREYQYVLTLKDTASAQRNSAHAQSEAARRAP